MKGYTDFNLGFMGPQAIATKPIGRMKYMDWEKAKQICEAHPDSEIYAGLQEDWGFTSGLIFSHGSCTREDACNIFVRSTWATPILDVGGEEIECWTYEKSQWDYKIPDWWGKEIQAGRSEKAGQ